MTDYHFIVFLDNENLGKDTKIGFPHVVCFQSYDIFNICSLIMLIYAN